MTAGWRLWAVACITAMVSAAGVCAAWGLWGRAAGCIAAALTALVVWLRTEAAELVDAVLEAELLAQADGAGRVAEVAEQAWDLDSDISAAEHLIGLTRGRWTSDDDSIHRALTAHLAATLVAAGLDPEAAVVQATATFADGTPVKLVVDGDWLTVEVGS